jgi:hypothetical protein
MPLINFNSVLDQVLKGYGKRRALLDYLLRVYPVRRALGLFLVCLVMVFVGSCLSVGPNAQDQPGFLGMVAR